MNTLEFSLRNAGTLIRSLHGSEKPAQGDGGGNARTNSSQPRAGGDSRIAEWAGAAGRRFARKDFGGRLDGSQVEGELNRIFRETPEFGRSLALRLADFHDEESQGDLTMIGGGGEAVVFFDSEGQQVIKLLAF